MAENILDLWRNNNGEKNIILSKSPKKRRTYEDWLQKIAAYKGIDTNAKDYNYKVFYDKDPDKAWDMLNKDSKYHFDDWGKTPQHFTYSEDSYYSGRKDPKYNPKGIVGGKWVSDTEYHPSQSMIDNGWKLDDAMKYINNNEPNSVKVVMPDGKEYFSTPTKYEDK